MFGTGLNSVIGKKRDLQLVMKWLTELVPYEPPDAIKVEITHDTITHTLTNRLLAINSIIY